ncbi:MAG: Gfo/Idh/MocA family oxidoreductase [Alicyclobacillus macrosporangiidus]|uniref:Gfo/Idh/MocA family protein n=1 Tax=Alicyclobacillus macrosporangiidus TaxID=392015 RepID=UPI0026EB1A2E|nr:Gfo/Idh/MocA family oxidoreductase [Alicyclobacillus macrosporangiidus]MCL6598129.1 Gfo/Idh/MocA family oxidoreductase [Alicyclobacillus macrosporangiidus]
MATQMPIRLGIVGLGTALRQMLPAFLKRDDLQIAAAASLSEDERAAFHRDFGVPVFNSLEALLEHADVDALYISTPTPLHAEHVCLAAASGKHVLVEKPFATTIEDAERMVEAVDRYRIQLVVGHSHSFDPPIQAMRRWIVSGRLGAFRMAHNWCYNDWLYRPRLRDELNTELGGGVTFRQGAHQFDILRYLGGGLVGSVRAAIGRWDPARPTEGAHVAFLEFVDGSAATAVYNGYDHFHTTAFTFGLGEWGEASPAQETPAGASYYGQSRKRLRGLTAEAEQALKRTRSGYRERPRPPFLMPGQPCFGVTVVSCERGDLRQCPEGLVVYGEDTVGIETLSLDVSPHDQVVDEFCNAVQSGRPPLHSGRWAMATLEVCLAVLESGRTRREVTLSRQIAVADPVAE